MLIFAGDMPFHIKNKQLFTLQMYNFLRQSGLLVISVILAKGHVSTVQIAGFETSMLLSTTFSFFVIAGLSHSLYPVIGNKSPIQRNTYYVHTLYLFLFAGAIAGILIVISGFFLGDESLPFSRYWLPATFILFNAPSFLAEHYLILEKRYKNAITWGSVSFALQILAVCIPLVVFKDLYMALLSLSLLSAFRFVFNLVLMRKHLFPLLYQSKIARELIHISLPVMMSLLVGSGFIYFIQIMVKANFDSNNFALYRYGTREIPLFAILTNSFSSIFSAKISGTRKDEMTGILNQGLPRLIHQVFIPAIAFMLLSPFLFKLLLNESLSKSWVLFNILLLVVPSKLVFPQTILLSMRKTTYLVKASIIESVVGLVAGFIGMYFWGITGIVSGVVLAYYVEKITLIYYCHREGISYIKSLHWASFTVYFVLLILSFLFSIFYL